jgi:hypothetical protein
MFSFLRPATPTLLAGLFLVTGSMKVAAQHVPVNDTGKAEGNSSRSAVVCEPSVQGSPYIPVDSWVYAAVLRLYSLDFVDNAYLGMRPWTRASLSHMIEETGDRLDEAQPGPATSEAQGIYDALLHELRSNADVPCQAYPGNLHIESLYSAVRGISGTPLRDSFHLGSTIVNDYGRPYENGLNNYSGASGYVTAGRFTLYVRGEFQGTPSTRGYSSALAKTLSAIDETTFLNLATGLPYSQATIPQGPIDTKTNGRFLEAYVSAQYLNHVISFGKQDEWLGPGLGGGMAFSNNAENFYSFRINRVEPLRIPLISRLTGPFRYEFLGGSLRGHTEMPSLTPDVPNAPNVVNPGNPWVHIEKVSFKPTENLELGFERTVIWGGEGHSPITFRNFFRSFLSVTAGGPKKNGREDPGARFGAFDFSYRLPFVRNWFTLYSDSEVHDDVSPIDAPRRASWRPGLYLSHVPGLPKLDLRAEAVSTDPPIRNSNGGHFMYWEGIERQGYSNQGQLFGDWIGREGKGGQAWITYHLSGNEWLQVGLRNQKTAKDFIPGGTTLNDINFQVVKRIGKDLEVNGNFGYERWKAPIYLSGRQTVTTTTIQLTWFPNRRVDF